MAKYNVTRACLKDLWLRRTWRHLSYPKVFKPRVTKHKPSKSQHQIKRVSGSSNGNSKLTEEQVRDIKLRLQNKESCLSISKLYSVSNVTIANIREGKVWAQISI